MSGEYVHKEGLVYKNQFHVIFCPKYRRPVLVDGVDVRLKEILLETASEMDVRIISMEVMPDHVHLFISFDPSFRGLKADCRVCGRAATSVARSVISARRASSVTSKNKKPYEENPNTQLCGDA